MNNPTTSSFNAYNHQNLNYANSADKETQLNSHSNWHHEPVQFSPNHHQQAVENNHSDANSPPLWKNSPSPAHSLLSSRAQAIARGQWELMEMVKTMPESSYELSLKDLVDQHRVETQAPPKVVDKSLNNTNLQQTAVVKVKRQESNKNEMRNGSFENKGLFLNMVFPLSFKSQKKNKFGRNTSGRVSPKPEGLKGGEKERWKKKFTGSSDSDSGRVSNNSASNAATESTDRSNSAGRKRNGCFTSCCWSFSNPRRSKSAK